MEKGDKALVIFGVLILFCITMILFQNIRLMGYATEGTTVSNVTISKYLSIAMSSNLSSGIYFGNVSSLPATNLNSTNNYDYDASNRSSLILNVSTDSNTNVDFCIRANEDLIESTGNRLGIGNETYSNSTTSDLDNPDLTNEVALNKTDYIKAGEDVNEGDGIYYRFWLDIPVAQPSGTYNNTITFKGVETTLSCGS